MTDWTVPLTAPKRCDMCHMQNRQVQAFTLVHTVKTEDGKRKTRSAGGIHLCPNCWKATGGIRRKHGVPRPELSANQLEAAAMRREQRAKRARLGKAS